MTKVKMHLGTSIAIGLCLLLNAFGAAWTIGLSNESTGSPFSGDAFARLSGSIGWLIRAFAVFLFTMFGILANVLWERPEIKGTQKPFWTFSTFRPLLVSPLIYYPAYIISKEQPDSIVSLLLAFQNGFFWQVVLARLGQQPGTP